MTIENAIMRLSDLIMEREQFTKRIEIQHIRKCQNKCNCKS